MAALPTLALFGTPLENLYQVGTHDRAILAAQRPSAARARPLPSLAQEFWNFFIKSPLQTLLGQALEHHPTFQEHLRAYAEGRGVELTQVALDLVLPDFYPLLLRANQEVALPLASSATFLRRTDHGWAHFKTLEAAYPFPGNEQLRVLDFAAPHYPRILTWSYPGWPFPLGHAWTSEGLTVSWHHLLTDKFNPRGQPLCELLWQLLNNAHDLKSALVFLQTCQVFTAASIIITDASGALGQIIMEGNRHIVRHPPARNYYYFNRHEALPLRPRSLLRPLQAHYLQQKRTAQAFLAATQDLAHQEFWPELLNPSCPGIWQATTVAIAAFNEQQLEIAHLTSTPPGHYQIAWPARPCAADQRPIPLSDAPREFTLAVQAATAALQKRQYGQAYTALRQAQAVAPQGAWQDYLPIYAALAQYFLLPERPRKAWWDLQAELKSWRAKLPPVWADHLALFIARIHKVLGVPPPRLKMVSPVMKRLLSYEQHLPPAVFLAATRLLTQLRPDILEIVYVHAT